MPFAARDDESRDEFAVADEHPGDSRLLAMQKLIINEFRSGGAEQI
jgi:hypothetical protein